MRLYYPTYQSNGSIIQRLIEARDLSITYLLANEELMTESFSLMGYTHNVTTNVKLCEELNREINLSELANTPENNTKAQESNKRNNQATNDPALTGMGTCFAASPDGHLVTNDHVIRGASKINVRLPDGEIFDVKLIKSSPSTDLAILKIDAKTKNFLPIVSSRSVKRGDKVFTVGYPVAGMLGLEAKYTEGVISSMSGIDNEPIVYQITVPVQPGNSGGPLVNEDGQVVGVITSTASFLEFLEYSGTMPQNINWAVKSDYLLPMIDFNPPTNKTTSRDDAINAAEKASCMVITES